MTLTAKNQTTYDALCRLPASFPMANWQVDVDPDTIHLLAEWGLTSADFEVEAGK